MYNVVQNVIASKRYELKDILSKIDTLWAQGRLSDEQRTSLISDAQNNARTENSIDVLNKLYELESRVTELEKKLADTSAEEEIETITYPEYEAGTWYSNGDIVEFDGQNYKCVAPIGTVCVWSPTEYPAYWIDYVEDEPLTEEDEPLTEE